MFFKSVARAWLAALCCGIVVLTAVPADALAISEIGTWVNQSTGTSCTISWETDYPTTENRVYFKVVGQPSYNTAQAVDDPQALTYHVVTVNSLAMNALYQFHVESSAPGIGTATSSPDKTFHTPSRPGDSILYSFAMTGIPILEGGDDVCPGDDWEDLMRTQHPDFTLMGLGMSSWKDCEANPPVGGVHTYDWSTVDERLADKIPGKAKRCYYQMWGTSPEWAGHDTLEFWENFKDFIEAQTIYINQNFGPVWVIFENEPNDCREPGWDWDDWYIHCLEHFYEGVHRATAVTGADNKVIGGNLAGHQADGYRTLYQHTPGLKELSDVVGCHPYPDHIRDGVKVEDLARMHEHMENYGDGNKKILITEGWGSGRSAGFDRSSPLVEPTAAEIENMWYGMAKGYDNLMTPIEHWDPSYLLGVSFFCANDNWGAMNWRARAIPKYDDDGDIKGFEVDGYSMTPDIAPTFWNGGMYDFYGNSKDVLHLLFPGDGLVFMNPGFELPSEPPYGYLPHFWTTEQSPAPDTIYSLDDVIYHGGSRSLKLTHTADGSDGIYQLTAKRAAQPGAPYRARVWCKTEDVDNVHGRFYMRFCNLAGTYRSDKIWADDVTGDSDWTQMEVTGIAPAYTSRIETGCYISGVGTVRFDDVTISVTHQEELGTVLGYTLDELQVPVPYSIVSTTTGGHQAVSDENGYYEMHDVPTGTYDFICRKPGYVPFRAKNQTVAAEMKSFVMFCMGIPKPGLIVTSVSVDQISAQPDEPVGVTVTVENAGQYPVDVGSVGLYVEEGANDATGKFTIHADPYNPRMIDAYASEDFEFTVIARPSALGSCFSINAYASAQEDRPNMLLNGGVDGSPWDEHWSLSANTGMQWMLETQDYTSPPNSLRCSVNSGISGTFNWGGNTSAQDPDAPIPAMPATSYTLGCYHRDTADLNTAILIYIEEYYYDEFDLDGDGKYEYYNGRKFIGMPHRDAWGHDCLIYETGDPNVTAGLYTTNRLRASVGPATSGESVGDTWWDDLYLKETGSWLADDGADQGAALGIGVVPCSLGEAFNYPHGTVVRVDGVVVTAGAESFADMVYVETPDRSCGTRVVMNGGAAPAMGDSVIVTGTVDQIDGEKAIVDAEVDVVGPANAVLPLSTSGRTLLWPLTQGLLVRTYGEVAYIAPDSSYFTIDDGSGLTDGAGNPGLKVTCDDALVPITPPTAGSYVVLEGVSACENGGAVPVVRLRSASDIHVQGT